MRRILTVLDCGVPSRLCSDLLRDFCCFCCSRISQSLVQCCGQFLHVVAVLLVDEKPVVGQLCIHRQFLLSRHCKSQASPCSARYGGTYRLTKDALVFDAGMVLTLFLSSPTAAGHHSAMGPGALLRRGLRDWFAQQNDRSRILLQHS